MNHLFLVAAAAAAAAAIPYSRRYEFMTTDKEKKKMNHACSKCEVVFFSHVVVVARHTECIGTAAMSFAWAKRLTTCTDYI